LKLGKTVLSFAVIQCLGGFQLEWMGFTLIFRNTKKTDARSDGNAKKKRSTLRCLGTGCGFRQRFGASASGRPFVAGGTLEFTPFCENPASGGNIKTLVVAEERCEFFSNYRGGKGNNRLISGTHRSGFKRFQ